MRPDDLVEAAGEYGADTVHTCTHDLLSDYGPDAWGEEEDAAGRRHARTVEGLLEEARALQGDQRLSMTRDVTLTPREMSTCE